MISIAESSLQILYTIKVDYAEQVHTLQCTKTIMPSYEFWGAIYFIGKSKHTLKKKDKQIIRGQVFEKLQQIKYEENT